MIYSACGSACPLTCANKDNPPDCIQECVQGCFCPTGMVTNAQGTCVSPSACPTSILIFYLINKIQFPV